MGKHGARTRRGPYSKESPVAKRLWRAKVRAQVRDALRHDREPDRTRGTQGWLTW